MLDLNQESILSIDIIGLMKTDINYEYPHTSIK